MNMNLEFDIIDDGGLYADVYQGTIKIGMIVKSVDEYSFIPHISSIVKAMFSSKDINELKEAIIKYYKD